MSFELGLRGVLLGTGVLVGSLLAVMALLFATFGAALTERYELWQGWRSVSAGEFGAALRHFDAAGTMDRNDAAPRLAKAAVYWRTGQADRARNEYEAVLERAPANAEASAGLGRVAASRGDWQEAIAAFRSSLATSDSSSVRVELAEALASAGDVDASRDEWRNIIARGSDLAFTQRSRFRLGLLLLPDGGGEALENLQAVALDGGGIPSDQLAVALQIAALPDSPEPTAAAYRAALIGYALLLSDLPALASRQFERAVGLRPDYADAFAYLGYSRLLSGDPSGSLVPLEQAISLAPQAPLPRYVSGLALRSERRLNEALQQLRRAVELDPENAVLHVEVGRTHVARGDYARAEEEYEEAARITLGEAGIASEIAAFYLDHLFRLDAGLVAAERNAAISPQSAPALGLLGWARYLNGDATGGISDLARAVALDEDLAIGHYRLAQIYEHTGEAGLARAEYRRVLDLDAGILAERTAEALEALDAVR